MAGESFDAVQDDRPPHQKKENTNNRFMVMSAAVTVAPGQMQMDQHREADSAS